jgi:hypothetical protein
MERPQPIGSPHSREKESCTLINSATTENGRAHTNTGLPQLIGEGPHPTVSPQREPQPHHKDLQQKTEKAAARTLHTAKGPQVTSRRGRYFNRERAAARRGSVHPTVARKEGRTSCHPTAARKDRPQRRGRSSLRETPKGGPQQQQKQQ